MPGNLATYYRKGGQFCRNIPKNIINIFLQWKNQKTSTYPLRRNWKIIHSSREHEITKNCRAKN